MCELACIYMYSFKKEIHEICAEIVVLISRLSFKGESWIYRVIHA